MQSYTQINMLSSSTVKYLAIVNCVEGAFITDALMGADPTFFDKQIKKSLIKARRWGLANSNRLFALMMFELWRREYGISLST